MENKNEMKKNLGVATATSLVVGCVIGAGIFFKPYAIYNSTGGAPGMGIIGWILGGIISIFAALTFAEVAILIPKTGGMVAYLTDVYSEKIGFLAGWMQVVIFYPAFLAGYGVKVGSELSEYLGERAALPVALIVIGLLVALNVMGSKTSGGVQIISTVCKLIPIILIIIFGFLWGGGDNPILNPLVGEGKNVGSVLGTTLLAVLFAFEGWTNVGTIAGEMKNPGKDLPKAIVGGVSIIMAVYLILNLAYLWVIPADQLMLIESPAAAVATKLFGSSGGTIIKVGIIISVLGAGNGFLLSGSRVAYQLSVQNTLPCSKSLSKLNGNHVPANAIVFVGVLACLYSLTGEFDLLTDLGVFSCWVFYTLTFTCVIRLRKIHPEWERKYKVPGYPVIPALAILSGLYVVVSQLFFSGGRATIMSLCSVIITMIGLPVYMYMKKKNA